MAGGVLMKKISIKIKRGGRLGTTNLVLTLMVLPAVLLLTVFHYFPLPGIVIAFAEYNIGGFRQWVGFENFEYIFGLKIIWDFRLSF